MYNDGYLDDNLKQTIRNSLSDFLKDFVGKEICERTHEMLQRDREQRWEEFKDFKKQMLECQAKNESKFDRIYIGTIATLSTTLATFIFLVIEFLLKK